MRIIAGQYRGRRIDAPSGKNTRPTTDRVRESLMSVVVSARATLDGARVLDAFAGSGALGLEALSRGAVSVCFYERDTTALKCLRANIASLGLSTRGAGGTRGERGARAMGDASGAGDAQSAASEKSIRICACDIFAKPPLWAQPAFDVVFLDPPYATELTRVCGLVLQLARGGALSPDAIIVYEHDIASNDELDAHLDKCGLNLRSRHKYGDTVLDFLELCD